MGAKLEALRELQEIELQLVDIRRQLAAKQRLLRQQAERLKSAEQAVLAEKQELKRSQMAVDELDTDLKARDAHLAKLRENLNNVRTNKEYAAILSQLNTERAERQRIETRAFELMEGVESRRKTVAQHETGIGEESSRLSAVQSQFDQTQQTFASRLTSLEKRRDDAATKLGKEALGLFNRVSERYEGEVMARVLRTHPRRDEFICEGCNMSLAAERANALLTRDDIITCDNCGRILFIERGT